MEPMAVHAQTTNAMQGSAGCGYGATEMRWYAVYTRARHERLVARQLDNRRLECFLPCYESVRRWQDRRVTISVPLFAGYVFVRFAAGSRLDVLTTPGVVRIVGSRNRLVPVPDCEIDALRSCVQSQARPRPHPFLSVGRRVRVIEGPMAGAEGILIRRRKGWRLVISVELISRAVGVELDEADVVPVC
jgi:transcription antitermination factor NusG